MIIVTSGAVGVGCQRLGLKTKPSQLAKKQALAAVGQVHLMKFYEDLLGALDLVGGLHRLSVCALASMQAGAHAVGERGERWGMQQQHLPRPCAVC